MLKENNVRVWLANLATTIVLIVSSLFICDRIDRANYSKAIDNPRTEQEVQDILNRYRKVPLKVEDSIQASTVVYYKVKDGTDTYVIVYKLNHRFLNWVWLFDGFEF